MVCLTELPAILDARSLQWLHDHFQSTGTMQISLDPHPSYRSLQSIIESVVIMGEV